MSNLVFQKPAPNPALERFLEFAHKKKYPNRSTIIHEGDTPDTLYYITQGSVRVMIEDEEGHEMVLDYLNKGDFFGEMGLFNADQRSAMVIARESSEIAEVTYAKFRELTQRDPEILYLLSGQIASRLRRTSRKVINLAFLDVTGRIAHELLELAKQPDAMTHPDGMQIRITRQEIAKIVGCSREMAGRVLKVLEDQGLIHAKGKTIVIFGTR